MNILVCLKQVPDTDTKIKIQGNGIDQNGIKWIINPYDEYAIVEAAKIKALKPEAKIYALSVGPKARLSTSLRTALAMGCDEAIIADTSDELDSFTIAKTISSVAKKISDVQVILMGKAAIDDNNFAVGQMTAEFLEFPHVTSVTKADYSGNTATFEREIEGGAKEIIELELPALITADKGLNQVKPVSAMNIMKVKSKVITEYSLADLGIDATQVKIKYISCELPAEKPAVKIIAGDSAQAKAQELAKLLREEAKVL